MSALPPTYSSRADHLFPTLTPAQIARFAQRGHARKVKAGELLFDVGAPNDRFFVVTEGSVVITITVNGVEEVVVTHPAGAFTGEASTLSGRPTILRARAGEDGALLELDREGLLTILQTDGELSEIVLRAFILRRVELIAHGRGDVVLVGSNHSPGTHRVKEFLTRNGHPYSYLDLDREADMQLLLDRLHVSIAHIPVVICRSVTILRNPTNRAIADCLGFNETIDPEKVRDVVERRTSRHSSARATTS